jgi:hypothetical protein
VADPSRDRLDLAGQHEVRETSVQIVESTIQPVDTCLDDGLRADQSLVAPLYFLQEFLEIGAETAHGRLDLRSPTTDVVLETGLGPLDLLDGTFQAADAKQESSPGDYRVATTADLLGLAKLPNLLAGQADHPSQSHLLFLFVSRLDELYGIAVAERSGKGTGRSPHLPTSSWIPSAYGQVLQVSMSMAMNGPGMAT